MSWSAGGTGEGGDPRLYHFDLPRERRPEPTPLAERWFPGARAAWPSCTSTRAGDPIREVSLVVIHATAGVSSRGAFSVMQARRASFHWLVPDENEAAHGRYVWATAPERRSAWHVRNRCRHDGVLAGRTRLNQVSLGVEIVNRQRPRSAGVDRFSPWQVAATAAIVRYAWGKYPNLRHVVSHARLDPGRRTDPGPYFPWEEFERQSLTGAAL